MEHDEQQEPLDPDIERYLALCERLYERMVRTGTWPWEETERFKELLALMDQQLPQQDS